MKTRMNSAEKNALMIRLERNQQNVKQLRCKLNSYTCEPTTQNLFERIEDLRECLGEFSTSNSELIATLATKKSSEEIAGVVEHAKNHLLEFNRIQKGVEDYIVGSRYGKSPV